MDGDTPHLCLTPGEPAGIGPELAVMLAQQSLPAHLTVIADPQLLQERAQKLGLPLSLSTYEAGQEQPLQRPGQLTVLPVSLRAPVQCGTPCPENAAYVLDTLRRAAEGCLGGEFDALVTGPVHKGIINEAGIPFTGHTEFLAELSGGTPVMMLTAGDLRVALATTHLPLKDVSAAITRKSLTRLIRLLHADLVAKFGLQAPNILVCGLNPHAGEDGHLGREEIDTIIPVLDALRAEGMRLEGPLPADTLFTPRNLERADAVLAMYHDQGLPVLKHVGFGRAVNITLGLPIVRTSVDHGTAFELACSGRADVGSLQAAVDTAIQVCRSRRAAA